MILVDRIAVLVGFFLALIALGLIRMGGEWTGIVTLFGGFWVFVFVTLRLVDWVGGGPARRAGRITAQIID